MSDTLPVGFRVVDNAISGCDEVIEWLESQARFDRSKILDHVVSEGRTSHTAWIPFLDFGNPPVIHEMNRNVWTALDEYAKEYEFAFDGVEQVSVQRYDVDQKYDVHIDAGPNCPRVVSALVYLNTVDEGGETYFPRFDVRIKPVQGRLAIFPSSFPYAHSALAPISGRKYAAAFWARG